MFRLFLLGFLTALLAAAPAAAQLYDVRTGEVSYDKKPRAALKIQVDGQASSVREYFKDWMKQSYNVRFKQGGIFGIGKSDGLTARQTPASTISGKLLDLYATFVAPSDSVTEVALFGGFDENTFFSAEATPGEFGALRSIAQNFAGAARLKAYRDLIAEAEKKLKDAEKEKEKLERSTAEARRSTANNLTRMEEMRKQNLANKQQIAQDSVALVKNVVIRQAAQLRLQRRRDRLTALDRKN